MKTFSSGVIKAINMLMSEFENRPNKIFVNFQVKLKYIYIFVNIACLKHIMITIINNLGITLIIR